MVWFVIGIILIIIAICAVIGGFVIDAKIGGIAAGVVIAVLGIFAILSQTFYTQDTGEASVLVDVSGNIAGQEVSPGFHSKAPWQDVKTFNIRNQQISYEGKGDTNYSGGSAQGPSVTAVDADGVSSEIDINVRYSLTADKVTDIYRQYKDEQTFVANYVTQTIRGEVRKVPNTYATIDVLTKQNRLQADIQTALEQKFSGSGVTVDNVSLQNVDPPAAIKASYAAAQQAQINVTKEKANLAATQVSAQQQVVQAKAQAEANKELDKGLTDAVLKSRYIDALKIIGAKGNLVIVPSGTNPIINTGK